MNLIMKIKKELQQGSVKDASKLLYRVMFSRESQDLLHERLGEETVAASIILSFIRSIAFSQRVPTICVSLKKNKVEINPDFFIEHITDLEDLFWVLLHERGHLILRILGYNELCNDLHNEFGFKTANFIEDVYINAISRQHIRSHLPERYYGEGDPLNALLTARLENPMNFPYEVVLLHNALYSVHCKKLIEELEIRPTFPKLPGKFNDEYYFILENKLGLEKLRISLYGRGPGGEYSDAPVTVRIDFPTYARVMAYYFRKNGNMEDKILTPVVGPPNKEGEEEKSGGEGKTYDKEDRKDIEAKIVEGSDVTLKETNNTESDETEENCQPNTEGLDYQTGGEHKSSQDVKSYKESTVADREIKRAGKGGNLYGYKFPELADPKSFEFNILFSMTKQEKSRINNEVTSIISAASSVNLQAIGDVTGTILTQYAVEEYLEFNSPVMPSRLSRKDVSWIGAGQAPIMYEHRTYTTKKPYVAYMDVSQSMDRWLWIIPKLEQALQEILSTVFHFSTEIVEVEAGSKFYYTTRGTNYNIVAQHIINKGFKNVIVVTDETTMISTVLQEQLENNCEEIVLISTRKSQRKDGFSSVATKSVTMER